MNKELRLVYEVRGRGKKAKPRDRVVPSVKGEVVIELPEKGVGFVREKDLILTSHPTALPYYLVKE